MKLLILHYRPKQLYPPLLNLMSYLDDNGVDYKLISTCNNTTTKASGFGKLLSILAYFIYTVRSIYFLMVNPRNIIYIESISAFPLAVYQKIFGLNNKNILVHYHEYFSIEDYKKQSFFERFGRKYELPLLRNAKWISHTNRDRLNFFQNDFPSLEVSKLHAMPNYPSQKWQKLEVENQQNKVELIKEPIKLLHIGALSFEGLYLTEVLKFFGNDDRFIVDFYSRTNNQDIIDAINSNKNTNFLGSIDYNKIFQLKGKYHIGLVLYRGNSLNFTYNAPNKIFEYLALDMDVWCSDKLITSHNYAIKETYPKMLLVDFEDLKSFNISKATSRKDVNYKSSPYICETVYSELLKKINENFNS